MTEHVHEWDAIYMDEGTLVFCAFRECKAGPEPDDVLKALNATERLSAELAYTALHYVEMGGGKMGDALRAYANILEGNDD